MGHGAWAMHHGPCFMDHGPSTTMDHGPWSMNHGPEFEQSYLRLLFPGSSWCVARLGVCRVCVGEALGVLGAVGSVW